MKARQRLSLVKSVVFRYAHWLTHTRDVPPMCEQEMEPGAPSPTLPEAPFLKGPVSSHQLRRFGDTLTQ